MPSETPDNLSTIRKIFSAVRYFQLCLQFSLLVHINTVYYYRVQTLQSQSHL